MHTCIQAMPNCSLTSSTMAGLHMPANNRHHQQLIISSNLGLPGEEWEMTWGTLRESLSCSGNKISALQLCSHNLGNEYVGLMRISRIISRISRMSSFLLSLRYPCSRPPHYYSYEPQYQESYWVVCNHESSIPLCTRLCTTLCLQFALLIRKLVI